MTYLAFAFALTTIGALICYWRAYPDIERGRLIGSVLSDDEIRNVVTALNLADITTDDLIKKGMKALTEAEIDQLLEPRYGPVQPTDFVVTERGVPLHFEDDHNKGAA